jgi:hypothetical protein
MKERKSVGKDKEKMMNNKKNSMSSAVAEAMTT